MLSSYALKRILLKSIDKCMSMTHHTVLLHQSIDALAIEAAGLYVDATYGRGGHSALLLSRLNEKGRLMVIDQDPRAIADAESKYATDSRVTIIHANFTDIPSCLKELGVWGQVNGILFDLGVSSPQLDESERGFSFMRAGPLDMRMNNQAGPSLTDKLALCTDSELTKVLYEYGEERFSPKIAAAILNAFKQNQLHTTLDLAHLISKTIPAHLQERHKHPATRTFQALRLWVNQELESLQHILQAFPELLAVGGRVAWISFHSLEDRLVKERMQALSKSPPVPRGLPVRETERGLPPMRICIKMHKPSAAEVAHNPRARSAILRVAERIG